MLCRIAVMVAMKESWRYAGVLRFRAMLHICNSSRLLPNTNDV
jgi:hypothetical protein